MHDAVRESESAGCGFLSDRDIDRMLADRLDARRRADFDAHAAACRRCALLAADLAVFARAADDGPLAVERIAFDRGAPRTRAALRQALEAGAPRRGFRLFGVMPALAMAGAAAMLVVLLALPWGDAATRGGIVLADGSPVAIDALAWDAPPVVRGAAAGSWQRAGAAYEADDWGAAAAELGRIEESEPSSIDAPLYRGVALVMAGRHAEAEVALAAAVERGDAIGAPGAAARYFLGVARLGLGEPDAARVALAESAAAGSERAADLLRRLGEPGRGRRSRIR